MLDIISGIHLLSTGCFSVQPAGAPDVTRSNLTPPFTLTSFALSLLLVFRHAALQTILLALADRSDCQYTSDTQRM